uniref:Uncharacterized protein n=1 Tax=Amphora coffeiformis TaxID=265554 RepID=A0A7S3L7A4_9STRA|mmetsp:Transcript_19401/g.36655  ORF Transcript_19401/g.36655 Transcript_19401/m.36655 type:complete len:252 (-) Transcript_19401:151-906(-)|eukprot:scaffold1519_cov166-Amphora_coffeaeformis.AAC.8
MGLNYSAILALLLSATSQEKNGAYGFTVGRSGHGHRRPVEILIGDDAPPPHNRVPVRLYGILDEINNPGDSSELSTSTIAGGTEDETAAYETLLSNLIFSTTDISKTVRHHFHDCTNPSFLAWLEMITSETKDEEERQALQDLMGTILQIQQTEVQLDQELASQKVAAAEKALQQRLEEVAERGSTDPALNAAAPMSAADVILAAKQIDQAVTDAIAKSDEDLPPDFIRDAKAVAGLSQFNKKGQMRVGGG